MAEAGPTKAECWEEFWAIWIPALAEALEARGSEHP